MTTPFQTCFSKLQDPRVQGRTYYPLIEIVFLCVCAIVSGSEGWEAIEDFGHAKLAWLRNYFPYENGIPVHDTIARVIAALSPKSFQSCFIEWVQLVAELTDGEVIAIDGKRSRGSYDKRSRKDALHMVSAWACGNNVVLGQEKTTDKSNEITAIPALLELLTLKGCIVTIDAMGCQKEIAEKIIESEADYVLALKGNHGQLHEAIQDFFEVSLTDDFKNVTYDHHDETDAGHGRIEERDCYTVVVPDYLKPLTEQWKNLNTLICVESKRHINGSPETERRYFISSLKSNAKQCASAIRQHWKIENSLHWVLDVTFKEDASRIRRDNAANNFTVLRHMALNLLKKKKDPIKMSIPRKRRKASYYDEYRSEVLKNIAF